MKRKMIPLILMLAAGAITSIITYLRDFELTTMLWILLFVLIVFYILGLVIKKILDMFDKQIKEQEEKEKADEGAVIEKELSEEDGQNTGKPEENQE